MLEIKPTIIEQDGRKCVLLAVEEFDALCEHIDDLEDSLLAAQGRLESFGQPNITWEEHKRMSATLEVDTRQAHVAEEPAQYGKGSNG
jgi:hypothetical protein